MISKVKKNLLVLLAGVLALCIGVCVLTSMPNLAKAEPMDSNPYTIEMVEGVSIRKDDSRSIRFQTKVETADINALIDAGKKVEVVTLISMKRFVSDLSTFNDSFNVEGQSKKIVFSVENGNLVDNDDYKVPVRDGYNLYNACMLSSERRMPFSHRHFSHLMCVYPLNVLKNDSEDNEQVIKNSMLEIEQLGTGWWVGFSFPWCATLYASIYNGNAAYEKLRTFNLAYLSQNGFHLNGDYKGYGASQWHYRPFTLEAQFAYCDAVQEMLLQDNKGYLELFPAMPMRWKKAEFRDLRVEKGLLISAKYENGKVLSLSIKSKIDTTVSVKLNGEIKSLSINKGNNIII